MHGSLSREPNPSIQTIDSYCDYNIELETVAFMTYKSKYGIRNLLTLQLLMYLETAGPE